MKGYTHELTLISFTCATKQGLTPFLTFIQIWPKIAAHPNELDDLLYYSIGILSMGPSNSLYTIKWRIILMILPSFHSLALTNQGWTPFLTFIEIWPKIASNPNALDDRLYYSIGILSMRPSTSLCIVKWRVILMSLPSFHSPVPNKQGWALNLTLT